MDIDSLTIGQIKQLAAALPALFGGRSAPTAPIDNGMIGKYVIVRCRDAGVHAGILESHNGRECVLSESRRLWEWKVADKGAFLSGIARLGIDQSASKIGAPIRIHLTENCEIIECTPRAEASIRGAENYEAK